MITLFKPGVDAAEAFDNRDVFVELTWKYLQRASVAFAHTPAAGNWNH